MTAPRSDAARFAYIDTLRGLAALYVLLYHLTLGPNPPLPVPEWGGWFIRVGGTGVSLFFVASAFTLCGSMRSRSGDPGALREYAIRRFFRIAPLFYAWVVLSWLRDAVVLGVVHPWWRVLLHTTFTFNFVPGEEAAFVWAGWTLGVETVFYLLFPTLYRWASSIPRALLLVLAAIGLVEAYPFLTASVPALHAVRGMFGPFGFFKMLPVFASGILAFHVHDRYIRGRKPGALVSLALVLGAYAAYYGLLWGYLGSWQNGMLFLQGPIYAILLLGLSIVPWTLLVNRVTVFLGVISYSVYLNHPTILWVLERVFRRIYALPLPVAVQFWTCALIGVSCVVAASMLTYRLIEQPGMRLGSWIIERGRAQRTVARAAAV